MSLRTEGLDALLADADEAQGDPWAQDRLWTQARERLRGRHEPFDRHLEVFRRIYAGRRAEDGPPLVWAPDDDDVVRASHVHALMRHAGLESYADLHRWSVTDRPAYWDHAAHEFGLVGRRVHSGAADLSGGPEDPAWFPGQTWNAVQMCFRRADGEKVAIVSADEEGRRREMTYGQLRDLAGRVAHGLRRLGLGRGDAVALYMPMTPECVALYLGVVQSGMVVLSIADSFAAAEVASRMEIAEAKLLATTASFRRNGKTVELLPKAREAAGDLPILVLGGGGLRPQDTAWEDLVAEGGPLNPVEVAPDHVSNVLFSSGTTGGPKAIPWTHLTPLKAAADARYHQDIHAGDTVAWPTNIGWMMGPWLIYAALANGATMALYEGAPTTGGFLEFCRAEGVSVLGVVPSIVRAWRAGGLAGPDDLPGVRLFSSTGEASNAEDYLWLMSLAGYAPVIEYCGGTEVGGAYITGSLMQPASPATFTTPALGIDFVVLDDDARPVPPGGHGEVFLVPPSVGLSQGLLNRDHHGEYYAGCPRGPDGELLRRHGDEIRVLHHGFWAAEGRTDDTMNLGGIKVASVELERVMDRHPDVRETAAVGVPGEGGGAERLVVHVVPERPRPAEDLKTELQARVKEELNPLFRIHDLILRDALPRTASNKLMRRELRAGGP